jgi:hypothetical protein
MGSYIDNKYRLTLLTIDSLYKNVDSLYKNWSAHTGVYFEIFNDLEVTNGAFLLHVI